MKDIRRLLPLILNTGLVLALVGAVLLSSCAKNSGSFQNSPAAQLRNHAQNEQGQAQSQPEQQATPSSDLKPSQSGNNTPLRSVVQIQSLPSVPSEFEPPTESIPVLDVVNNGQKNFDRYQDLKAQEKEAPTARQAIFETFPLAWERKQNPERRNWSRYTYQLIEQNFESFEQVQDAHLFCKHYMLLDKRLKMIFWGMLISQISFHESGWNPMSRSREASMGVDGVTKTQVYSEGLMQMSYQDSQWSSSCKFDWSKDQNLSAKNPKRTILNPYVNLACGIKTLADQVGQYKQIVMKKNVYWAVLHEGGRYSKVAEMSSAIQRRLPFCR